MFACIGKSAHDKLHLFVSNRLLMITIAVDAMGGDFGLSVTVPAAVSFLNKNSDARLIMVGDEVLVTEALKAAGAPLNRIEVQHASEVVEMDESPQLALKNKKQSSMRLAINEVKEARADAAVSAGNTGALMATARYVLKTLSGVDRPAIAKFMPNAKGTLTCVLDLGANIECSAEQLVQFGMMGAELVRALYPEKQNPSVGLLNIGTEDIKGTTIVKEAHQLFQLTDLNYMGNVEGDDIYTGDVDVIATDGFVGNVALKASEGIAKMFASFIKAEFKRNLFTKLCALLALPVLNAFKDRADARRYNGAIFLGLRGVVVKSHGGTDEVGFAFALQEAYVEAKAGILSALEAGMTAQMTRLADRQAQQQAPAAQAEDAQSLV